MKHIYIILTYSGTFLSRVIRVYTRHEFSHVSIALDENLDRMYSFGRLNPYNPFRGGFVHEGINIGTFKRFYKTESAVYSTLVTDEQYKKIEEIIRKFENCKIRYKFNIAGLFAAGFNIKISNEHAFYCAEFIKYIYEKADIKNNLPEIVKPEDFEKLENISLEYKGKLKEYKVNRKLEVIA